MIMNDDVDENDGELGRFWTKIQSDNLKENVFFFHWCLPNMMNSFFGTYILYFLALDDVGIDARQIELQAALVNLSDRVRLNPLSTK